MTITTLLAQPAPGILPKSQGRFGEMMARSIDLAVHVRKLVEEKQRHQEALAKIEQTLGQISSMLGGSSAKVPTTAPLSVEVPNGPRRRRRQRRKFAVSGNDLILNFVKQRKRPTTREIGQLWKTENRSGKVDNLLSVLVKAGRLKRTPLGGGERGSRYSLT